MPCERKHIEAIEKARVILHDEADKQGSVERAADRLAAAISAALAAADESPWRSMDSAPKDGSYMLLMLGDRMVVGYWSPLIQSCVYACLPVTASHWMPLPAAPEVKP